MASAVVTGRPSMRPMVGAKFVDALRAMGGVAEISLDQIAQMSGVSLGTARQALLELEQRGSIRVSHGTGGTKNTYSLPKTPKRVKPVEVKVVEPMAASLIQFGDDGIVVLIRKAQSN